MQAIIDDQKWSITFKYGVGVFAPYHAQCRTTGCVIERFNPTTKTWDEISTGFANCDPRDIFEKEKGRKVALTRALKDHRDKKFRHVIWQTYLNRQERRIPNYSLKDCVLPQKKRKK